MNVTPLIDVLLVLIIIFLVVSPTKPYGLNALLPQDSNAAPSSQDSTVVLQVTGDGDYRLNSEVLDAAHLPQRLREVFSLRATKVLFLQAAPDTEFSRVARAIDLAKGAGIDRVGLLTKPAA